MVNWEILLQASHVVQNACTSKRYLSQKMDDISLIKVDEYRSRRNMYLILLIISLEGIKGPCVNERYVKEIHVFQNEIHVFQNEKTIALLHSNKLTV